MAETKAVLRGVRLSVDKGRLVADLIRGKKVDQALNILAFTQKKGAVIVKKVDDDSKLDALRTVALLPIVMFLVYLGMILYFRSKGGYKPVVLDVKQ